MDRNKEQRGSFVGGPVPIDLSGNSEETISIRIISDTHTHHRALKLTPADAVVFCGDEADSFDLTANEHEALDFFEWYAEYPAKYRVYVPGNHSRAVCFGRVEPQKYCTHVLIDRVCDLLGYKFFGSPWTPSFGRDWAYMRSRQKMSDVWQAVPDGTEILLTHGPPKGILDMSYDVEKGSDTLVRAGCNSLARRVSEIKPMVHAFGHMHDWLPGLLNFGAFRRDGTTFINASCCEIRSGLRHSGMILKLPKRLGKTGSW